MLDYKAINAAISDALSETGGKMLDDLKASISTPCPQYHTGKGGHSKIGDPPFLETGLLRNSMSSETSQVALGVEYVATTQADYWVPLEETRPFAQPALDRWIAELTDVVLEAAASST